MFVNLLKPCDSDEEDENNDEANIHNNVNKDNK